MPTVTLIARFGDGTDDPSPADMERAIHEVFVETNPACSEADYAEHPNAWLNYGEPAGEGWSVTTLDLYRTGEMRFTRYADQDDAEPEFELTKQVGREEAVRLWLLLHAGNIAALRGESWCSARAS
ncbi:MAG: hypothetical protein QOF78_116 [Phycisphaerales bacterium]|jgi:hypothetical protein|nr:hypothetical protein [Phycisphaerales bacterium]